MMNVPKIILLTTAFFSAAAGFSASPSAPHASPSENYSAGSGVFIRSYSMNYDFSGWSYGIGHYTIFNDYTYGWYRDSFVPFYDGWFFYDNGWRWGGYPGRPTRPPSWRPDMHWTLLPAPCIKPLPELPNRSFKSKKPKKPKPKTYSPQRYYY